LKANIF